MRLRASLLILLFCVMSAVLSCLTALVCVAILPKWYGLVVGIGLMLAALPLYFLASKNMRKKQPKKSPKSKESSAKTFGFKQEPSITQSTAEQNARTATLTRQTPLRKKATLIKLLFITGILLNSLGTGFSMGAYYSYYSISLKPVTILLGLAAFLAIALPIFFASLIKKHKALMLFQCCALLLVLLIVMICFWVDRKHTQEAALCSLVFFLLIIQGFYLIAYFSTSKTKLDTLRKIAGVNFSFLIAITVIVAVILSGGEGLDGLDFSGAGGSGKKSNKTQKPK